MQPLMVVPEGREPDQLLHLFKGKFVIHTTHNELKVSPAKLDMGNYRTKYQPVLLDSAGG